MITVSQTNIAKLYVLIGSDKSQTYLDRAHHYLNICKQELPNRDAVINAEIPFLMITQMYAEQKKDWALALKSCEEWTKLAGQETVPEAKI